MSMFDQYVKSVGKVKDKHEGLMVGVVTNNVPDSNADDGKQYAVKVKFPGQANNGQEDSCWARVATFGAGPDRGIAWLPEVDDEVVVAFVHGDFNGPVVIGSVWNGVNKTTYANKDASGKHSWASYQGKTEAKKNDIRALTSRTFHQLIFNDNADEPRIALHSGKKHRIVLDDNDSKFQIEIYDGKQENYILIDQKNKKITMEATTGDILIKAKDTITLDCKTLETKSSAETNMTVGSNFNMKASSNMVIKASGTGDIESSGTMTFKGSIVNIN